jgi:hypothetical protein
VPPFAGVSAGQEADRSGPLAYGPSLDEYTHATLYGPAGNRCREIAFGRIKSDVEVDSLLECFNDSIPAKNIASKNLICGTR